MFKYNSFEIVFSLASICLCHSQTDRILVNTRWGMSRVSESDIQPKTLTLSFELQHIQSCHQVTGVMVMFSQKIKLPPYVFVLVVLLHTATTMHAQAGVAVQPVQVSARPHIPSLLF